MREPTTAAWAWLEATYGVAHARSIAGAYRSIFSSPIGQTVLVDLMSIARMNATPFVAGQPDLTAFRAGQQAVLLHICDILGMEPDERTRLQLVRPAEPSSD